LEGCIVQCGGKKNGLKLEGVTLPYQRSAETTRQLRAYREGKLYREKLGKELISQKTTRRRKGEGVMKLRLKLTLLFGGKEKSITKRPRGKTLKSVWGKGTFRGK